MSIEGHAGYPNFRAWPQLFFLQPSFTRANLLRLKSDGTPYAVYPPIEIGQKFGRLEIIGWCKLRKKWGKSHARTAWKCRCVCGRLAYKSSSALRCPKNHSCGRGMCRARGNGFLTGRNRQKYYHLYRSYYSMLQRCFNPKDKGWLDYGNKGVTVCGRWCGPDGFSNFLADMGNRPRGKSLDRINPFGNYEPGNCRWATRKVQANNQRRHYTPEEVKKNFEEGVPELMGALDVAPAF